MKCGITVWEISKDYRGATIGGDDSKIPMSAAFFKVADGPYYMRRFDADGVSDDADFKTRIVSIYRPQGILVFPWSVAQGRGTASLEGSMLGKCAAAVGGAGIVDLEDGPGYWSGSDSDVDAFVLAFRQAGGKELWLNGDFRKPHLSGEHLAAWLKHPEVTRFLPQSYWTDFQQTPTEAIDATVYPLTSFSPAIPANKIFPMLPGDGTPAQYDEALEHVKWLGCPGISIFRRGNMSQALVDHLNGISDPF